MKLSFIRPATICGKMSVRGSDTEAEPERNGSLDADQTQPDPPI